MSVRERSLQATASLPLAPAPSLVPLPVPRPTGSAGPFARALLYAYHETDACALNLGFLLRFGGLALFPDLAVVLVVNGHALSVPLPLDLPSLIVLGSENEGLDFGAYSAGLAELARVVGSAGPQPELFGFLNCGVSGPFLPAFLSPSFDWFGAFASRLNSRVRLVGAYLSCLPAGDAGGRGPRIEGHSFFTDAQGLRVLEEAHVMRPMLSKYDAIVNGEYGLTRAVFTAGFTIDTLLYRYQNVDWRDEANWDCNGNRFVGRGGGYEGGDVNPFETIFFKRVWPTLGDPLRRAVRYEETARYLYWRSLWDAGGGGAHGDAPPPAPVPPYYDPGFEPDWALLNRCAVRPLEARGEMRGRLHDAPSPPRPLCICTRQ